MKPTKFISAFVFAFLVIFSSCQKDDGNSGSGEQQENIPETFSEYFGNEISRDFLGTVIDKNHNPIEGVNITIGSETAITDSNGVFIIRDADVNERFGYVKAEKVGYIDGSRSLVPSEGTNKVQIMLLEETIVGTVSSGSAETITANNGSSVSFDGNFIKEDGSAYSGTVDVIMHHLDPTDDDMTMQMPGMLYAENEDGAERMLQTLGMLAVELRGSGGEDLNLAEGSTSEIKIPIDASLLSSAPATIPLWYFDEANGYWKEEGVATLQGNMYYGTVSHFSFWNYDIPAETITLCVTTINENDNLLSNLQISITSQTFGTTHGYTNENGEICGFVPSNESLLLSVYNFTICGETPVLIETIGPFDTDSNVTFIVPTNSEIIQETVIGTFNTCNGEAVTDGYVYLNYGNQIFTETVTNGTFEINVLRCAEYNTFSLSGFDFTNTQSTGTINYTFINPTTNIGNLNACNIFSEFFQYTIDGVDQYICTTSYMNVRIDSDGRWQTDNPVLLIDLDSSQNPECTLECLPNIWGIFNENEYTGTYGWTNLFGSDEPGMSFSSFTFGDAVDCLDMTPSDSTTRDIIYNLNTLGQVGDYLDINFSGSYLGEDGMWHTVNGIVHATIKNIF